MNEKTIKELVKIVENSDISELEVSHWGKKVRIVKNTKSSAHSTFIAEQNPHIPNAVIDTPILPPVAPVTPPVSEPEEEATLPLPPSVKSDEKTEQIHSPMVGTFYRAPGPDSEPYVKEGDRIDPGKVLCIVEAMKLMNEIEAEISGTIVEILVENAQPVEYNQPLFKIAVG